LIKLTNKIDIYGIKDRSMTIHEKNKSGIQTVDKIA